MPKKGPDAKKLEKIMDIVKSRDWIFAINKVKEIERTFGNL